MVRVRVSVSVSVSVSISVSVSVSVRVRVRLRLSSWKKRAASSSVRSSRNFSVTLSTSASPLMSGMLASVMRRSRLRMRLEEARRMLNAW